MPEHTKNQASSAAQIQTDGVCAHHSYHVVRLLIYVGICRGRRTRIYFPFRATHSAHPPPHRHGSWFLGAYYVIARATSPLFRAEHPFVFSQFQLSVAGFLPLGRRRRFLPSSSFTHTHTHTVKPRTSFSHRILTRASMHANGTFAALSLRTSHTLLVYVCAECRAASAH